MKKLLFGTILLALVSVFPIMTMAAVDISIGISLPPPIVFAAPPEVIVIPETYVYVVPNLEVDIFFHGGWWWRPWEGRWYRSHYYDRGWSYYQSVPSFYFDVDPGWRRYYRDHNWGGHRWRYERISHEQLQRNWKTWNNTRRWEKQGTWGVQGYRPRPQPQRQELRRQRQEQYQQRPDVRQVQQRQQQQRQPQGREPQGQQQRQLEVKQTEPAQHQPQVQQLQRQDQPQEEHSQFQGQQHRGESQHTQSQGKPQRGDAEHRK